MGEGEEPNGSAGGAAGMEQTVRQQIISFLSLAPASAKEISAALGISEREVYDHLGHIRKSLARGPQRFEVTPSRCLHCGFVFDRRQRLTKPGRCPGCQHPHISEPRFRVTAPSG